MYSKFSDMESVVSAFGHGPVGDPTTVNSMVSGLVGFGRYEEAFELLGEVRRDFDFKPTDFSFGIVIKACGDLGRGTGEQIHGLIVKTGFDSNCFVGTSLVDMYGRFGDMESLEMVFWSVSARDLALYNATIVGFSQNCLHEIALEYFSELKLDGCFPNECTFSSVIKACGGLKSLNLERIVHGIVEMSKFQQNLVVNTTLIDMYMKCGKIEEGRRVFVRMNERNIISYNTVISGLGQIGYFDEAMNLFIYMNRHQLETDLATFVALVGSCLGHGWSVYAHAIKRGLDLDPMVQNVLLDGLFERGAVKEALEFFNKMHEPNVVSWTTVISGLTESGFHSEAIELIRTMRSTRISPNRFTFSSSLKACGSLAALEQGRCIHACVVKHGAIDDKFTSSSILDMYAKCGALEESYRLFDELPERDVVSWNTMITGFAQHGHGQETLELYARMQEEGIEPNQVTFISLLSACSHCGLVDDGVQLLELMVSRHGVIPCLEHYACMVDMFGRAGMLDRAKCLIDSMPFEANASIWMVFLAACKLHGNVDLAKLAREHVMGTGGEENPTLVLMSNMYSGVGKWDDAEKSRKFEAGGVRKEPGVSWVQIKE